MRGLGTEYVISGPTRGLKNKRMGNGHQTEKQTNRHVDSMTDPAQKAKSVKMYVYKIIVFLSLTIRLRAEE